MSPSRINKESLVPQHGKANWQNFNFQKKKKNSAIKINSHGYNKKTVQKTMYEIFELGEKCNIFNSIFIYSIFLTLDKILKKNNKKNQSLLITFQHYLKFWSLHLWKYIYVYIYSVYILVEVKMMLRFTEYILESMSVRMQKKKIRMNRIGDKGQHYLLINSQWQPKD